MAEELEIKTHPTMRKGEMMLPVSAANASMIGVGISLGLIRCAWNVVRDGFGFLLGSPEAKLPAWPR